MSLIKAAPEVAVGCSRRNVTVRVVTGRQGDDKYAQAVLAEALSQSLGSALPGMVVVLIKGEVDRAVTVLTELSQLQGSQMSTDGTGGIAKAFLPEHRQIE